MRSTIWIYLNIFELFELFDTSWLIRFIRSNHLQISAVPFCRRGTIPWRTKPQLSSYDVYDVCDFLNATVRSLRPQPGAPATECLESSSSTWRDSRIFTSTILQTHYQLTVFHNITQYSTIGRHISFDANITYIVPILIFITTHITTYITLQHITIWAAESVACFPAAAIFSMRDCLAVQSRASRDSRGGRNIANIEWKYKQWTNRQTGLRSFESGWQFWVSLKST